MCNAEGVPLDLEPVRQRYDEYVNTKLQSGERSWPLPPALSWHSFERRHREIDMLSGTNPSKRSGDDKLQVRILDALLAKLNRCDDISIYVNKFIAHAAIPESRAPFNIEDAAIALGELWEAHEVLCRVANTVDVFLLTGTNHGFLAAPQYDQFRYIERPLVPPESVTKLREAWDAYDKETGKWQLWTPDELLTP